jgi:hypothetical protein
LPDEAPNKVLCVRVTGPKEAFRAWLSRYPAELYATREDDKDVSAELFLPEEVVEKIDRKSLRVEVLHDATKRGRERQKEVGKGNRFEGGRRFEGLGKKTKDEPR